jgi:hypothetical protein
MMTVARAIYLVTPAVNGNMRTEDKVMFCFDAFSQRNLWSVGRSSKNSAESIPVFRSEHITAVGLRV